MSTARRSRVRSAASTTVRIARWETSRSVGTIDRRSAVVVLALLVVMGGVGLVVADRGVGLEEEIYAVGLSEGSPYAPAVEEDERLRPVETDYESFAAGEVDVDVFVGVADHPDHGAVHVVEFGGSRTERAAYDAFRDAVEGYNDRLMNEEPDRAAAYPVLVTVSYESRSQPDDGVADGGGGDGSAGAGAGADAEGDDDTGGTGGSDGSVEGEDGSSAARGIGVPDVGGSLTGDAGLAMTPGALAPPFPFESLVLAFLFVVPMNFVIQAYGSTIVDERINRRGELLLVAPVSRHEIVAGKSLPYLLGLLAIVAAIALVIGGGPVSVAAAVPIALLFLAATFVGAMLARSFKELTFVTVTVSVFLTTYTFVPAIFTDVTPIALISPLTLIVMDLQGDPVSAGAYLFSTAPFYCSAAVLYLLGVGVYREEDMFTQKPVPAKALDAIAGRIRSAWSVPLLSILFIPFVFAAQLLAVSLLFAVPEWVALPALLVAAAAIEEFAKSVHVYAGFARSRFSATTGAAVVLGTLSGVGFFVGEKATHVVHLVGLPELEAGLVVFGPALSADPLVLAALFLAPLVLHVVTATIAAVGASRGRTSYAMGLVAATLVHAVYNLGVIAVVA